MNWNLKPDIKMKLLLKAQREAFKLVTFFRKSTPTKGLEVLLGIRPLDLQIRYIQVASYLRTKGFQKFTDAQMYTDTPSSKGHRQRVEEWVYANGCNGHFITMTAVDDVTRKFMWNKLYRVDRTSMSKDKKKGKPLFDSQFAIYTDGSKDGKQSGGGIAPFRLTVDENQ